MKKSEKSQAELYLEKARSSGLMNEKNEAGFLGVAEMLKHPFTAEQMREQVRRHQEEVERLKKKPPKEKIESTKKQNIINYAFTARTSFRR